MTNTKTEKITFHFSLGSWLPIWRLVVHFDFSFFPRELITNLTPCCSFSQRCKCANVTTWHFPKCANVQMWRHDIFPNVQTCKCANVQMWRHDIFFPQCLYPIAMAKIFSCKVDNAFFHCHGQNIFPLLSLMCHGVHWALDINNQHLHMYLNDEAWQAFIYYPCLMQQVWLCICWSVDRKCVN